MARPCSSSLLALFLLVICSSEEEAVDVSKALIHPPTEPSDLKVINDGIKGRTFDEKNANYLKEGIPAEELDGYVRKIASNHGFAEPFILDIIAGKDSKLSKTQGKEFVRRVGKYSTVKYYTVATVKNSPDTIDIAIAVYGMNFGLSDRVFRYKNEKEIFDKFLRLKAITGFIEEYPHLSEVENASRGPHDEM